MNSILLTYFFIVNWDSFEEFRDRCLVQKGSTDNSEDFEGTSVQMTVMFDDCYQTVSADGGIYLYSDRIFGVSPERFDKEMLLDPFEEELYLPSVLIQQGNVFSLDVEGISDKGKCSSEILGIIDYSPKRSRVFLFGFVTGKFYGLVHEDAFGSIENFFTVNNLILEMPSLTYYEKGFHDIDFVQSCKIEVSLVKDIVSVWSISDLVHEVHVVNFGSGNVEVRRDLGDYIIYRMNLYSSFRFPEWCPPEISQAQVNRRGINSIEPAVKFEKGINPLSLGDVNHIVSELFKDLAISSTVCLSQVAELYLTFAETKVISLGRVCGKYIHKLSKTHTTCNLTIHHNKQLIPTAEEFDILVTIVSLNNSLKGLLRKEFDELCENIFSRIHCVTDLTDYIQMYEIKSWTPTFEYNYLINKHL